MPAITDTRDRIIATADALFYAHGYAATSFMDIAQALGISRGNFYYYFKTKDEILAAVIEFRLTRTRALLDAWSQEEGNPAARVGRFIQMLIDNQVPIMAHGCPVGTLCAELAKLDHPAQPQARALFTLFRDWLRAQFDALGQGARADALALHALMRSQGIAMLATAFRDPVLLGQEVAALRAWLADLSPNPEARV